MLQQQDEMWMQQALQLARQGQYTARPNPCVGAVIVKNNTIIGSGWHQCAGEAHAEVHALQTAGDAARDATCYVTLEPCAHHGRTPPCCEALVKAGISKVVVAMQDPHPKTNGLGLKYLQAHGIEVIMGVLASQAKELNRAFLKRVIHHQPWVTLKLGMTLDGNIADHTGHSQWVTGSKARQDVQQLRAQHAAIMSSATTVLHDNARLTVREFPQDFPMALKDKFKQPLRVILDKNLNLSFDESIFDEAGDILIYTKDTSSAKQSSDYLLDCFADARNDDSSHCPQVPSSVEIVHLPVHEDQHLSIATILADLANKEINSVLIEAGGTLAGSLLQHHSIDEYVFYISGKILGQQGKHSFNLDRALALSDAYTLQFKKIEMCGDDIKIVAVSDRHCERSNSLVRK